MTATNAGSTQLTRPRYRPDIDGLRAVAVLLVLADHLHLPVAGGYVGVDVFFVISGYLISSVILAGMQAGTFTFSGFYERRIRRIAPALVVMLIGVSVMVYVYDTPSEVEAYGASLFASVLSVSNILFSHQAGYFDAPSAFKPLLHTWSLGVEEQFYILFPLFLVAVRRWMPHYVRAAILSVAGFSFLFSCFWVFHDASAAYFLAPLRAWELLLGTIASQRYLPRIQGSVKRNLSTFAGILLILIPAVVFNAQTHFPGLAALPPCLGAALIIAAGETGSSFVSRILSLRPVVFIGLISYSLYLWHWPVIVFQHSANLLHLAPGRPGIALKIVAATLILAVLSWRFVERPFRHDRQIPDRQIPDRRIPNRRIPDRGRPGRRLLFLESALAAALLLIVAAVMVASHGLPSRFPARARGVAQFMDYSENLSYRENVCFLVGPKSGFADFSPSVCLADSPAATPPRRHYLLLGDSHAAALYAGLAQVYSDANVSEATAAGCRPFVPGPGVPTVDATCSRLLDFIFGDYLTHHPIDAVLLAGRWQASDTVHLGNTVRWIQNHGMAAVVFGPSIEYDVPLPRLIANSLRFHSPEDVEQHRSLLPEQVDRDLAGVARTNWKADYISMYDDLCVPAPGSNTAKLTCPEYDGDGGPLLFDMDHLTSQGSVFFARAVQSHRQLP